MVTAEPVHRALLAVDVERSGDPQRHNDARIELRKALFKEISKAFHASGIDWMSCTHHDTGDGVIVTIPPEFPKQLLLHPVLDILAKGLRYHNRHVAPAAQIRVRVAIHDADVRFDSYGVTGRPMVLLARLLDSRPLRNVLAAAPPAATVAAIISERVYEDVVCQGHVDIDPALYTRVEAEVKETHIIGWLHLPSYFPPSTSVPHQLAASDKFPDEKTDLHTDENIVEIASSQWRSRVAVNHEKNGLFGIEKITNQLTTALASRTGAWILSVRGTGGVGKTTVAYEAADRVQCEGAVDQVLWATVRGDAPQFEGNSSYEKSWMETVVDLADQLGVSLGPNSRLWSDEIRYAISQYCGRILTVVDNLETANQAATIVDRLYRCGFVRPHKLLVTSRSVVAGPANLVQQHSVRGLEDDDAIAFMRYVGEDDEHLALAPESTFIPIVRITEGNPYLLKLVAGRYLSSAMSLDHVAEELTDLEAKTFRYDGNLASQVKDYLFDRSLEELDLVAGPEPAHMLMAAFCVKRRGDEIAKDELREISGLHDVVFKATLQCACDLGLVQASRLNWRYSIHSLLYEYTRPAPNPSPGP